jgi:hypothetical protein
MTCERRDDLALFAALGALEAEELAELQAERARECAPLAQVDADAQAALAQLALALPDLAPPDGAKARFLARLAAAPVPTAASPTLTVVATPTLLAPPATSQVGGPASGQRPTGARAPGRGPAALAAAFALLIAALLPGALLFEDAVQRSAALTDQAEQQSHAATRLDERERTMDVATRHLEDATRQLAGLEKSLSARQQDYENARRGAATAIAEREQSLEQLTATKDKLRLQTTRADRAEARLAGQQQAVADTQKRLATADAALAALRSPQMRIITLAAGDKAGKAWGRIVWDQQAATWNLVALDLPPAPAGRTYELWFITDKQQKIAAGTFDVNAKGEGALAVRIPAGIGSLAVAAVTDEPAGGVAAPTGSIQLVGQL